jgi:hypothetical protein
MATIRARKQGEGSSRYTAIVRIRRGKAVVYAWAVVQAQRRSGAFIFPYEPRSVGAALAGACRTWDYASCSEVWVTLIARTA